MPQKYIIAVVEKKTTNNKNSYILIYQLYIY